MKLVLSRFLAGFQQVSNQSIIDGPPVLILCYSKTSLAFFWYRHISFDWNYWIDTSVLLTLAQSPWGHKAVKGLKARPLFFSWKVCNFTMGWNNSWNFFPPFLVYVFSRDIFSIFIIMYCLQSSQRCFTKRNLHWDTRSEIISTHFFDVCNGAVHDNAMVS